MQVVPIESKQISYIQLDDNTHSLTVHYHTGEIRSYSQVQPEDIEHLLASSNKYDSLVSMFSKWDDPAIGDQMYE